MNLKDRLRDFIAAYIIPVTLVSVVVLSVFFEISAHPFARFLVYLTGFIALGLGMVGLIRRARDHYERTEEDPPLFLISLFWQKVAIAIVLLAFMVSSLTKALGYESTSLERFTLAGHVSSSVAFAIVSLLLFLDSKRGLLYRPTKPGLLGWIIKRKAR